MMAKKKVSLKALSQKWKRRVGQLEELFKYTIIVVSTVIFFLVFFYALDIGINALKQLFLG